MQEYDPIIGPILYWLYLIILILVIGGLAAVGFQNTPGDKEWEEV